MAGIYRQPHPELTFTFVTYIGQRKAFKLRITSVILVGTFVAKLLMEEIVGMRI